MFTRHVKSYQRSDIYSSQKTKRTSKELYANVWLLPRNLYAIFLENTKTYKNMHQKHAPKTFGQTENIVFRAQELIPYAHTKHAKTYKSDPYL
jgi:hypothetical protein